MFFKLIITIAMVIAALVALRWFMSASRPKVIVRRPDEPTKAKETVIDLEPDPKTGVYKADERE